MWSAVCDKVLKEQSIAPIKMHRQLCQQSFLAYFPLLAAQNCHGTCFSENCASGGCQSKWYHNTKQSAWSQHWQCGQSTLTPQEIPVRSASEFSEWQRGGVEGHTMVPIPGGRLLRQRYTKVCPTVWKVPQFRRWICWKIAQQLQYLFQ